MNLLGRFRRKSADLADDVLNWLGLGNATPSVTGIAINQQTALMSTAVLSVTTVIADDVSKLTPYLYRLRKDGGRDRLGVKDHPVAALLRRPNSWQTWFEFCNTMMLGLLLKGNAYAVILRNWRGEPTMLVPINPDRVAFWAAPDGSLFCWVTRAGLHEMAVLRDMPMLIPYEDMFHLKDLSPNGLVGVSRIYLAREAIALGISQEQLAARWAGNGAQPIGVLQTDAKLTPGAAERLKKNWEDFHSGIKNTGKTAVLEQGLKWSQLSLSSQDMEFIQSRNFQLQEVARVWRVPLHMVGELSRSTNNNISQQSQDYVNLTITSHTTRIEQRFASTFDLDEDDLEVELDKTKLLQADIVARMGVWQKAKVSGILTTNEIRTNEGYNPVPGGDQILEPANLLGSDQTGTSAEGGGRPPGSQNEE